MKEKEFDQAKYIKDFRKKNYKQISLELKEETKKRFAAKCKENNTQMQTVLKKFIIEYIEN